LNPIKIIGTAKDLVITFWMEEKWEDYLIGHGITSWINGVIRKTILRNGGDSQHSKE